MRTHITRALCGSAAGAAVTLLGLAGAGGPASAASQAVSAGADSPVTQVTSTRTVTAYVVNYVSGTVTPIDTATGSAGYSIPVGTQPSGIAITRNGKNAYVISSDSVLSTVTPIWTATRSAGVPIPFVSGLNATAITPNGKTVYVTNGRAGTVTPIWTDTEPFSSSFCLSGERLRALSLMV
jgi:YVTN family beta-propeller protein